MNQTDLARLNPGTRSEKRILAIDPISRGFGFAVLEGSRRLIDWGVIHVQTDKLRGCLRRIDELVGRYRPLIIVTEDTNSKGSRRGVRVRELVDEIRRQSPEWHSFCRAVSRIQVRRTIRQSERATKYEIALSLIEDFPELRPRLPKPRKPWMSEDARMAIFDALAFGLTYLRLKE
jgi:hypothetical protein